MIHKNEKPDREPVLVDVVICFNQHFYENRSRMNSGFIS